MKTFEELGLQDSLLRAIGELGFEVPMPVQEEVIPYLLGEHNDVVALAQTGTGKTAAFGLPILQTIDLGLTRPQALILSPTRELCLQIADDLKDYAKYLDDFRVLPVYGGSSIETQIKALRRGVQVIVATPGRLLDLMNRGVADLSGVRTVVLDEADEMLDMGFSDSLNGILAAVPEDRSTLLFSATMPDEIAEIAKKYMRQPHEIVIGRKNESTATVRHIYYMVQAKDKYRTLKRIIDYYPNIYGIIFCRTKVDTQEIADKLMQDGYNADALHGDLSQAQRDYVMQRFRLRNIRLLVATDVAARGLDVDDLTHIINYTLPDETEAYTHRSGRTGRAGKTGISISIINLREKHRIRAIEKIINKTFEAAKMPTGKEICKKQIFNLTDRLERVEVNDTEISELLPSVFSKLEWLDKEELIRRMVAMEFNRIIAYYQDDEDFETLVEHEKVKRDKKEKPADRDRTAVVREQGYAKIYIGLGKADGLMPKNLLDLINSTVDGRVEVGRIDLLPDYALFDVDEKSARKVVAGLRSLDFLGRGVKVEIASDSQIRQASQDRADNRGQSHRRSYGDRSQRLDRRVHRPDRRFEPGDRVERPERDDRFDKGGKPRRNYADRRPGRDKPDRRRD
ncbi:MAG: DEAD/DEAH box helicase [Bacteroidales bacterium]|nr:DEAD/DEAH box helicase [Bacteroidales bacterium]